MRVLEPLGELSQSPEGLPMRELVTLDRRRVGFLWGRHAASVEFWPVFEKVVEKELEPVSISRVYKSSTWSPATPEELASVAEEIDLAFVGVGA